MMMFTLMMIMLFCVSQKRWPKTGTTFWTKIGPQRVNAHSTGQHHKPTILASTTGQQYCYTGQHRWPAVLASNSCQHHWPAALAITTGQHHWPGIV
jgi:hypothetical protein